MTQTARRGRGRPKGTGGKPQANPMYNPAFRACVLKTAQRVGIEGAAMEWGVSPFTIKNWQGGA